MSSYIKYIQVRKGKERYISTRKFERCTQNNRHIPKSENIPFSSIISRLAKRKRAVKYIPTLRGKSREIDKTTFKIPPQRRKIIVTKPSRSKAALPLLNRGNESVHFRLNFIQLPFDNFLSRERERESVLSQFVCGRFAITGLIYNGRMVVRLRTRATKQARIFRIRTTSDNCFRPTIALLSRAVAF